LPRFPDRARRSSILSAAKKLFALRGFAASSVASIASEAGIPVGSVYTYFRGKDEILVAVIEEGWREFSAYLETGIAACPDSVSRLGFLVRRALPALYADVDLIAILFKEGAGAAGLGAKLDSLAGLVAGILGELDEHMELPFVRTALAIILLGCLDAVSLGSRSGIGIGRAEVGDFIVAAIERAFGIELP
jgi:AcrR family transcriptional regulator